jgi:hypothetical protein
MIDFMFFVKTVLLTVALVLLLQIQVDDHTIEAHALGWVQSSTIAKPMNLAAHGAAKMINDLAEKVWTGVHHNVGKKHKKDEVHPESEHSSFFWRHSAKQASSSANSDEN